MDPLNDLGVSEDTVNNQNSNEVSNARDFFQHISRDGKSYSKCLIKDCQRMLSGVQKFNLERHLSRIHNMIIVMETPPNDAQICRLCFTKKAKVMSIFTSTMNIVNTIRLHFLLDDVSENDLLPKNVCLQCWKELSKFHDFYVAVNEARIAYFASIVKIEDSTILSEVNIDSFGIAAEILGDDSMIKMEYNDDAEAVLAESDSFNYPFDVADVIQDSVHEEKCENIMECELDVDNVVKSDTTQVDVVDVEKVDVQISVISENAAETVEHKMHKYFKPVRKNCDLYSECLIEYCHRTIAGNENINLTRHLRIAHNINLDLVQSVVDQSHSGEISTKTANQQEKNDSSADLVVQPISAIAREKMVGFRKHFQSFTKNGKIYSKCLIEYCNRVLAGKQKTNLERHLEKQHQMRPPFTYPRKTTRPSKYFKIVKIGCQMFSKCLVENCDRLLLGRRKHNLERHLKMRHNLNQTVTLQNFIEHESENSNAETANQPNENQIYRSTVDSRGILSKIVKIDGKSYSQCLVDHCNQLFVGENSILLDIHLRKHIKQPSKVAARPKTSSPWKYFKCFSENGKFYAKCLISGCDRMLIGKRKHNLERHLLKLHGNNVKPSDYQMDNTPRADTISGSEPNPNDVYIYYDSDHLNGSFFEAITKDGKLHYKCTVKHCHRILSAEKHLLRRHLNVIHKIEDSTEQPPAVREFFERVTENGNSYCKCLVENCGRLIAGNQRFNMQRHLRRVHKKF